MIFKLLFQNSQLSVEIIFYIYILYFLKDHTKLRSILTKVIEYVKGLQLNLINVVLFFLRSYLLLNPSVEP